ncbi:MAG: sugar phosphate isomerase/epimerase [Devosia sp.]|nr:sugar phosphate isomerase/epimerase [Devosia sp.]
MSARQQLQALLRHNAENAALPALTPELTSKLAQRLRALPLFAHSYPFCRNMDFGGYTTWDYLDFAFRNDLTGVCLHVNDGDRSSLSRMDTAELGRFRQRLEILGLKLHLEISSTDRAEVNRAIRLADVLGVVNIRLYARHEGPLDTVIERVYADLAEVAEKANRHGLHFDYEQHEDLRAAEIARILERIGDHRVNALFDYTNSWNALEDPLDALRTLAPWVRQVHIKGGRKTVEPTGWGQVGVPQGDPADSLPGPLLLAELVALGAETPQVICFALENEVDYYAPPFRVPNEGVNPIIAYREPSSTPMPEGADLASVLRYELRWAQQQVGVTRALAQRLQILASLIDVASAT